MTSFTTGRRLGCALAAALLCAATVPAVAQSASSVKTLSASPAKAKAKPGRNVWIVQMAEPPVTAYDGGISGLRATKPGPGQKIDPNAPEVTSYMAHLAARQDVVLNGVGGGRKLYSYGYAFNGFAAELTEEQAAKLATTTGVLAVSRDEARPLDTATTPGFLGLTAPGGAWSQTKGEGVVIGIVDGGIWPESLSFSDRTGTNGNASKDGKLSYRQLPGWHGRCVPGEAFDASMCNQKLIGARYYNAGWGGNAGIDATMPWEFNSPRDYGGHGTHTASTAGGNAGVPTGDAFGTINGIAPRARIAAYKVCWETGSGGSCFTTDSVAAIDQAVADGVDVINFSIGGSRTNFRDPVAIAFLFAADAGVFVAASAGNSGPASSTVAHPGPWMTTVAAGTHDRAILNGSLTLGDGRTFLSPTGTAKGVGPSGLVDAAASGLAGADPATLALCFGAADDGTARLDPAQVAGKIVVCERGGNFLVNKAQAVLDAGGVGMALVNTPSSANTVPYVDYLIPAVHLQNAYYAEVKAYASVGGATATINAASIVTGQPAPFTAGFSSRGPLQAGGGDLLKPDLIAPGQDILAAVAPPGNGGRSFAQYSGTSMSSPHVAGLAALMKEKHPGWSPMAIKSALMTTGSDVLDGPNTNPLVIFRQGAGHVRPNLALDPGLVYDSNFNDWLALICAKQPEGLTATCNALWAAGYSKDASDMNVASIAIGDMAGVQTVKRRVTNVSGGPLTVNATVTPMAGFTTTVAPSTLTVQPGKTAEFTIAFTRTDATLNVYTGGQLTWTGGGYTVRSPIVVRPVALAAPAAVTGSASGTSYDVTFGYTGPFTATPRGLVPAATVAGNVVDDPANDINTALSSGVGITVHLVNVPAGTSYARFSLFDDATDGNDDLDLYVFRPDGSFHGGSGSGTSAEEVNVADPVAGNWFVVVHGWQTDGADANYTLYSWTLGTAGAGNMTVSAPASATTGATGTISLGFSGLAPATKYLGSVVYGGASGMPSPTIVRVDTP